MVDGYLWRISYFVISRTNSVAVNYFLKKRLIDVTKVMQTNRNNYEKIRYVILVILIFSRF